LSIVNYQLSIDFNCPLSIINCQLSVILSFGGVLEPRYIFGAGAFDQWSVTNSLNGGCF